jgi:hypothetical protein
MNMDETMIRYINGRDHVWRNKFSTAKIKTNVDEKAGITAILTITASGHKLSCMVIKKGSTYRSISELSKKIVNQTYTETTDVVLGKTKLAYSPTGWTNTEIMLQYLADVIIPYTQGKESILALDNYGCHITDEVIKKAKEMKINIIPLPTHTTHILQPLDVGINGPIKQISKRIRREKEEKKEAPIRKQDDAAMHIDEIWNENVTHRMITSSWKKAFDMDVDHLHAAYERHSIQIQNNRKEEQKKRKREMKEKGKRQVIEEESQLKKSKIEETVQKMKERDERRGKKKEDDQNQRVIKELQKIHCKNVRESKKKQKN